MKAESLIKEVRDSTQRLYNSYQLYIQTDGESGLCCFNPDVLMNRLSRTDKEIVEQGLAKGLYIEDADDYLSGDK